MYKEEHDFEFGASKNKSRYRSDIVRPELVIARYFTKQQTELDELQAAYEQATQTLESFVEDNSGEQGLIEEAKNDKGKVTQALIKERLKETNDLDEVEVLNKCLKLLQKESQCKSAVKTAKDELDKLVFEKIPAIPEDELKDIVINSKWFTTIENQIIEEIERVTQNLANRVKTLEQRYAKTLPQLDKEVDNYSRLVEDHLKKMGLSW